MCQCGSTGQQPVVQPAYTSTATLPAYGGSAGQLVGTSTFSVPTTIPALTPAASTMLADGDHAGGGHQASTGASLVGGRVTTTGHAASTSGGVRNAPLAIENFNTMKQEMMAKYGNWRKAEAEGWNVRGDYERYKKSGEAFAHVHGPQTEDGRYLELMYEITPSGPGRLVGIMTSVEGDLGAGEAHGHGDDGMMQHIWFMRKPGLDEYKFSSSPWQEMNPNDMRQLDLAYDGGR